MGKEEGKRERCEGSDRWKRKCGIDGGNGLIVKENAG